MPLTETYVVDSKEEVRILDKAGNVVVMYRIWATTKKGTYFHIDVEEAKLADAPKLLEARAKGLDAI